MLKLHNFLQKQLIKRKLNLYCLPDQIDIWKDLIRSISQSYYDADENRKMLERSLMISSEEMAERWVALQTSETYKRSIFELSVDGIMLTNDLGIVTEVNRSVCAIYNTDEKNIIGKYIVDLFSNYLKFANVSKLFITKDDVKQNFDSIIKMEMQARCFSDQIEFPVEVSCIPVQIKESEKMIYIWYIRDLRMQKEYEFIIEKQRSELVLSSKLATLGEMAGGIAHEINTPLATMKFSVELIKQNIQDIIPDMEFIVNKLEVLDKTIDRINNIVKSLRNFARDGSADPLAKENIKDIIKSTIILCNEKFKKYNIKFSENFIESKDLFIMCRSVQISQVILNLLNNSFDAIEQNSEPWIHLEVKEKLVGAKKSVLVLVTDCGNGIPKDIVDKIFNPFFTTKGVGKGTGMGLSISMGLAKSHNGDLYYDHSCQNTRFILELPQSD